MPKRLKHFAIPQRQAESAEVVLYDHERNKDRYEVGVESIKGFEQYAIGDDLKAAKQAFNEAVQEELKKK